MISHLVFKTGKNQQQQRRRHSAAFKAEVALAAIRGDKTQAELARQHGVRPSQVTAWKNRLLAQAASVFMADAPALPKGDVKALRAKVSQLSLENDFLEGALVKASVLLDATR